MAHTNTLNMPFRVRLEQKHCLEVDDTATIQWYSDLDGTTTEQTADVTAVIDDYTIELDLSVLGCCGHVVEVTSACDPVTVERGDPSCDTVPETAPVVDPTLGPDRPVDTPNPMPCHGDSYPPYN